MTTFTEQQLYEIRLSARSIAEEEIATRRIKDPDVVDFLASHLFIMRDLWASFDDDADSYEPVISQFFGDAQDTSSKLYAIDPKSADLGVWDYPTTFHSLREF